MSDPTFKKFDHAWLSFITTSWIISTWIYIYEVGWPLLDKYECYINHINTKGKYHVTLR